MMDVLLRQDVDAWRTGFIGASTAIDQPADAGSTRRLTVRSRRRTTVEVSMGTKQAMKPRRHFGDRPSPGAAASMERTRTLVATSGGIVEVDTIRLENAWWLVCSWHDGPQARPRRIVRLSGLAHEEVKGQTFRFVLTDPLPAELLAGRALPGFHVRDLS